MTEPTTEPKIEILIPLMDGRKLTARWPTDEEWLKRQKARRLITRPASGSRGATETTIQGGDEADLELLKAISGAQDLEDSAEAALLLQSLSQTTVTGVDRAGDGFEVGMETFLGPRTFKLRRPSAAQIKHFRTNFARPIDLPYGQQETRISLTIAAELFDQLCDDRAAPIIFKAPAVGALVSEIERILEPSRPL